jgi:RNA methyltransferase, TrmH family
MIITSFSNQHIKYIRKLDQKKYRQQTGEFFVEGLRTVGEAVQTGAPIQSLVIAPDLLGFAKVADQQIPSVTSRPGGGATD